METAEPLAEECLWAMAEEKSVYAAKSDWNEWLRILID